MNLTQIFELGDDQLKAHFNIIFPIGVPPLGSDATSLTLRAKGFKVPPTKLNTYDVPFHGLKLPKTSNIEETKSFTLEIRMAKDWKEYKLLKQWLDSGFGYNDASRLPDEQLRTATILQPIDIAPGDVETPSRTAIKFDSVKLIGLDGLEFTHDDANPIYFIAEFIYVTKEDIPY